ncbi:uncharacterized protein MKK02DRAFT_38683 [Dioszegia hungarica]|uniref:Uncharacterized protein n=1 Tax=Dioszegia hungarica TaxID=4972 RepID=A0AA38H4J1_9TREE|nr:uncharacterized protein MKK02DRAFT_38683 [Dioszegia hungarica]KAI9634011.1 hypothetical protein MKK02DRAFT_38683 [Dioszegia hungarica]
MSEPSSSSATDVVWDEVFGDQTLDVVLKSTVDNVYFRASSYTLKKETSLYNGMFTMIPNVGHMTPEDAIPLDFDAPTITIFLACVNARAVITPYFATFPVLQLGRLLHIVRHADCERLLPPVEREYKRACVRSPHDWLLTAIELNDLNEVADALRHSAREGKGVDFTVVKGLIARVVDKAWHLPLFCAFTPDTPLYPDRALCPFAWPTEEKISILLTEIQKGRIGTRDGDGGRAVAAVA